MTFGEGKDKVYMLLDEHSAGGSVDHDEDIEMKMAGFFDICQKNLAQIRRIVKTETIQREPGKTLYEMPKNFGTLRRIWRDGFAVTKRYKWMAGKMIIPETDRAEIIVEYYAIPKTITDETPDDEEFEIADDAAQCMPFFVAAQQLAVDLVVETGTLLNLYDRMVMNLPRSVVGDGGGGMRQTFFRR